MGAAECQRSDDAVPFSDLWIQAMPHVGKRNAERLEEPDCTLLVERRRDASEMPDELILEQLADPTHISFLQERVESPDHGFAFLGHADSPPLRNLQRATGDAVAHSRSLVSRNGRS